jgi:hypothetical protein
MTAAAIAASSAREMVLVIPDTDNTWPWQQVLGSDCALLCEVLDKRRVVPANLLLRLISFRSLYMFTVLARQVLVQSSSSSRARSKRVQPDHVWCSRPSRCAAPHTWVYILLYLPPSFLASSVRQFIYFMCTKHTDCHLCVWSPLFDLMLSVGPGKYLFDFTGFISAAMSLTALCLFSLSKGLFFFLRVFL